MVHSTHTVGENNQFHFAVNHRMSYQFIHFLKELDALVPTKRDSTLFEMMAPLI
jgi:hypothetical protein